MRKLGSEKYTDWDSMKAHGYDHVDYGEFINTDNDIFSLNEEEFRAYMLEERRQIDAAGLSVYQTHGPWRCPPQDGTKEEKEERLEKMKRSIKGTAYLGGTCMVIHPIMPYGLGPDRREDVWEENKAFFTELLKTAEEEQVIICLENMPFREFPMSSPEKIYGFVKEMNSPWFCMCLDTGHCMCRGESPAEALKLCGDKIKALHIHDNDGASDWHWLPLFGNVDWEAFREELKGVPEEVPLNLETQVKRNFPDDLREYFCKGLVKIARYLIK